MKIHGGCCLWTRLVHTQLFLLLLLGFHTFMYYSKVLCWETRDTGEAEERQRCTGTGWKWSNTGWTKSNHLLITTVFTRPCHSVPHLPFSWTFPEMVTLPPPWPAFCNASPLLLRINLSHYPTWTSPDVRNMSGKSYMIEICVSASPVFTSDIHVFQSMS